MHRTARPTQPRLWRSLALAGAAGIATAAPLAAEAPVYETMGASLWLAQADGGEGGESGAVANVSPEVAYLARLAIVEGHLVAAVELYRKGMVDEAVALSYHPEAEMMEEVRTALAAHGATDFSPSMAALSDTLAAAAPMPQIEAALAAVQDGIAAAATHSPAGPRQQFDALVVLTRAAATEYQGAITDGVVVDQMVFQEAHGFIEVAKAQAKALTASADPVVAAAAVKALAALDATHDAFAAIETTTPKAGDGTLLTSAAARIELASYPVK